MGPNIFQSNSAIFWVIEIFLNFNRVKTGGLGREENQEKEANGWEACVEICLRPVCGTLQISELI